MKRPHLLICDDLEDNTPLTEKQRESLRKWYKEMDKQPIDYAEDEAKEWEDLRILAEEVYPHPSKKRWWEKRIHQPCWWCLPATCLFLVFAGMLIGEMLRSI